MLIEHDCYGADAYLYVSWKDKSLLYVQEFPFDKFILTTRILKYEAISALFTCIISCMISGIWYNLRQR